MNGIYAEKTKTAFGEMIREGSYIRLSSAYFRKIERLIGKDKLRQDGNVAIVIWKDDVPTKILVVIDGELVDSDAGKKYPSMNLFQLMNLIEDEIKEDGGQIYDVVVKEDDFIFYNEQ